eukprot:80711-Chlamydomonas_euryale.AAC.2
MAHTSLLWGVLWSSQNLGWRCKGNHTLSTLARRLPVSQQDGCCAGMWSAAMSTWLMVAWQSVGSWRTDDSWPRDGSAGAASSTLLMHVGQLGASDS